MFPLYFRHIASSGRHCLGFLNSKWDCARVSPVKHWKPIIFLKKNSFTRKYGTNVFSVFLAACQLYSLDFWQLRRPHGRSPDRPYNWPHDQPHELHQQNWKFYVEFGTVSENRVWKVEVRSPINNFHPTSSFYKVRCSLHVNCVPMHLFVGWLAGWL